jgi:hypothetical protein
MPKITVYKVRLYDAAKDTTHISRRMATRAGADRMRGEVIEGSAVEIDASKLMPHREWTSIDSAP